MLYYGIPFSVIEQYNTVQYNLGVRINGSKPILHLSPERWETVALAQEEKKIFKIFVGENIARACMAADLTQDELAELSGISKSFLAHVEKGDNSVSLPTLCALAKALQVSCDSLLFRTTDAGDPHIRNVVRMMTGQTDCEKETSEQIIRALSRLCKKDRS